jgi:hypothetical protein
MRLSTYKPLGCNIFFDTGHVFIAGRGLDPLPVFLIHGPFWWATTLRIEPGFIIRYTTIDYNRLRWGRKFRYPANGP